MKKIIASIGIAALALAGAAHGEDQAERPQITMGDGERNAIMVDGLTREAGVTQFVETRDDGGEVSLFRGDAVTLSFPEVTIEKPGFLVLHPVMDGRPNGDVVSGFTYLTAGTHENVKLRMDTPADAGRKFLVMLHTDVDDDKTLDFVFVEDGINVEDTAVFEGTHMIAKIFACLLYTSPSPRDA